LVDPAKIPGILTEAEHTNSPESSPAVLDKVRDLVTTIRPEELIIEVISFPNETLSNTVGSVAVQVNVTSVSSFVVN